jgi:DNA-binding NarL/FixJ family response regulator
MSAQSFEGTGPASDEDPGVPVSGMSIERILIVEDNWLVAIEMEAALSDAGYKVIGIAMSADQAVQLCETERPDAVLMDVRLQGQRDGVDAAIEVRARFGIRSVFVTAHGESETRARAEAAEPLGWIVKPISSAELIRHIQDIALA